MITCQKFSANIEFIDAVVIILDREKSSWDQKREFIDLSIPCRNEVNRY